ncbi:MAG: Fis family transcriptional regulator [Methylococcales bacterium]|nr:MAG: Fis family transcriptional regulator [Methylococcales bacterium]
MIEEAAVVVKIEHQQVWVTSGQNSACGGCQQKASCTTNALASVISKKQVPVDCDMQLKVGDEVVVAIDEGLLLRASLLLYLLPLAFLFLGAGIANGLLPAETPNLDLWIASSALLSFLLSLWLINKAQSLLILNYYARPVVLRKC